MKPKILIIASAAYLVGLAVTFFVLRAIDKGHPDLAFVVGAILATQVGTILHHRQPEAKPNAKAKAALGGVLALCAIVYGVVLHLTCHPFEFVDVSIPICALGSFGFPFVLFNSMWKALTKGSESNAPDE